MNKTQLKKKFINEEFTLEMLDDNTVKQIIGLFHENIFSDKTLIMKILNFMDKHEWKVYRPKSDYKVSLNENNIEIEYDTINKMPKDYKKPKYDKPQKNNDSYNKYLFKLFNRIERFFLTNINQEYFDNRHDFKEHYFSHLMGVDEPIQELLEFYLDTKEKYPIDYFDTFSHLYFGNYMLIRIIKHIYNYDEKNIPLLHKFYLAVTESNSEIIDWVGKSIIHDMCLDWFIDNNESSLIEKVFLILYSYGEGTWIIDQVFNSIILYNQEYAKNFIIKLSNKYEKNIYFLVANYIVTALDDIEIVKVAGKINDKETCSSFLGQLLLNYLHQQEYTKFFFDLKQLIKILDKIPSILKYLYENSSSDSLRSFANKIQDKALFKSYCDIFYINSFKYSYVDINDILLWINFLRSQLNSKLQCKDLAEETFICLEKIIKGKGVITPFSHEVAKKYKIEDVSHIDEQYPIISKITILNSIFMMAREKIDENEKEIIDSILLFNQSTINLISLSERFLNEQKIHEERKKIMANLSHSIKNLLGTIIDPLENMKQEKEVKPIIIDNAIKGANLIRNIVNAMNLSLKGSAEDYYYDSKENTGSEALSLKEILLQSLTQSISNLFDAKHFGIFMRNYFADREVYMKAKKDFDSLSLQLNLSKLNDYINTYFLDLNIDIDNSGELCFGNEKGSAVKTLILFQEVIFNALKYSSFVSKKNRKISVELKKVESNIIFKLSNLYKEGVATKSSGLGLSIVKNFVDLMNGKLEINNERGIYMLNITFPDYWQQGGNK
jgi:signal transduction histidine kinase